MQMQARNEVGTTRAHKDLAIAFEAQATMQDREADSMLSMLHDRYICDITINGRPRYIFQVDIVSESICLECLR